MFKVSSYHRKVRVMHRFDKLLMWGAGITEREGKLLSPRPEQAFRVLENPKAMHIARHLARKLVERLGSASESIDYVAIFDNGDGATLDNALILANRLGAKNRRGDVGVLAIGRAGRALNLRYYPGNKTGATREGAVEVESLHSEQARALFVEKGVLFFGLVLQPSKDDPLARVIKLAGLRRRRGIRVVGVAVYVIKGRKNALLNFLNQRGDEAISLSFLTNWTGKVQESARISGDQSATLRNFFQRLFRKGNRRTAGSG